ncbi:MAG: TonB-dependent receptor plug domain-containing protein [Opitutae bacterium]|nr:TonB-dependent receptor plug domain-containing protein [Opitutae bacterium]
MTTLGYRVFLLLAVVAGSSFASNAPEPRSLAQLKELSLEELLSLQVSTASRTDESWWKLPSGIDVVTADDIRRAGVLNLPDALRLATGVQVGQSSTRSWAVSVRGMGVLAGNKINVMMDGRSLFSPFFSGVLWDAQDTLLEDIDRIEVVRGPVGSLWGAFAVNGLIQILTKPASATQGWLASAGGGSEDPRFASFRYGGRFGEAVFYRVYAKYAETDWTYNAAGQHAQPSADFFQTGFRLDGTSASGATFGFQGDYYTNQDLPRDRVQTEIDGFNVLGRWGKGDADEGRLEFLSYYDQTYRLIPLQFEEARRTAAASAKFERRTGIHHVLVGGDASFSRDRIGNFGVAKLLPARRTTHAVGAFLQDVVQVAAKHELTAGVKLEHNSFSGFEYQPTLRHAWLPDERTTVWGAVSRAVRPPVRIDRDLVIEVPGRRVFEAAEDFATEISYSAEIGFRRRVADALSVDVSGFRYWYDRLRSTEFVAAGQPLTFGNRLNADSWGGELTMHWQPARAVLLKASYRYLDLQFDRDPGSTDTSGGSAEGNDAKHVATLAAHFDLPRGWEFDAFVRHASDLPRPALPGYTVADLRLGWRGARWEWSIAARNLGDRQFPEFITTNSLNQEVSRRWTAKVTWRY